MFILGIGKDVDSSELNQIASGPNNVFTVDSFKELNNKANEAKRGICILGTCIVCGNFYHVSETLLHISFFPNIMITANKTSPFNESLTRK